jgi:hypothetical protein
MKGYAGDESLRRLLWEHVQSAAKHAQTCAGGHVGEARFAGAGSCPRQPGDLARGGWQGVRSIELGLERTEGYLSCSATSDLISASWASSTVRLA